jgi:RNA polymerase sigma-70 factor (ECF subfamily)
VSLDAEALFHEHHEALFRYLLHLSGDEAMARDAVQHAFLRLLERPPEHENVRAWLYTVATNAVREWKGTSRRRSELLNENKDRVPVPGPEPEPDRSWEAREEIRRVRKALDELGARDRTILLLRAEGFKHKEIAEVVGTTTGSVGTMAARALDKLARRLDGVAGS